MHLVIRCAPVVCITLLKRANFAWFLDYHNLNIFFLKHECTLEIWQLLFTKCLRLHTSLTLSRLPHPPKLRGLHSKQLVIFSTVTHDIGVMGCEISPAMTTQERRRSNYESSQVKRNEEEDAPLSPTVSMFHPPPSVRQRPRPRATQKKFRQCSTPWLERIKADFQAKNFATSF